MPSTTPPQPALPDGLTTRPLRLTDSRAVFELMAAQEHLDIGEVGDRGGRHHQRLGPPQPRPGRSLGRRLRRRRARGVRRADGRRPRRHQRAARPTAAAASAPGWPTGSSSWGARSAPRWWACRCPRAHPATGCWRPSASACAGPAGCSPSPRARRSRRGTCPRATRSDRPGPRRRTRRPRRPGGRVPRVVGARARVVRGLRGRHVGQAGLRAVEPPRRARPAG